MNRARVRFEEWIIDMQKKKKKKKRLSLIFANKH